MLRSLRNKSQSIFFKIFLVLIVLGFAAWGVGDLTGGNQNKPIFKTEKHEVGYKQIIKDFDKFRNSVQNPLNVEDAIKNGILNQVLINHKIRILVNEEGLHSIKQNLVDIAICPFRVECLRKHTSSLFVLFLLI